MDVSKDKPVGNSTDMLLPAELKAMPPAEAEQVFNALPFESQRICILQTPWKDRMEVLMLSRSARELVQSLPPEELFWTVKQRGVEDSLPIISRTTHEQFQYLIDIDCWQREQLLPDAFLAWYRILGRCNAARVLEWFRRADDSMLVSGLKRLVRVYKIEEDSDISEEYDRMPSCTIDGVNYLEFADEDAQLVLLPLFRVLYSGDAGGFQSLIEGLIWDSVPEAEQDALHWRQSRVAENGFPLFDEALALYQLLSPHETRSLRTTGAPSREQGSPEQVSELSIRYCLKESPLPDFLRSACARLFDAEQLDRFQGLLIATANKVMVADCLETGEIDSVRRALRKAAGYVSIGLEHLCTGDPVAAADMLARTHPELLFRCGYGLIAESALRVRRHEGAVWVSDGPRFIGFYGTPLADTAMGLARSRPLLYEGLVVPHSSLYRDFQTCAEVQAAAACMDMLIAADRVLFKCAGFCLPELEKTYVEAGAIGDTAELSMTAVLATLLVARSLKNDSEPPLLEPRDLGLFAAELTRVAGQNTAQGFEQFADQALIWLEQNVARGAVEQTVLRELVRESLAPVLEQTVAFSGEPDVDFRYVSAILVKRV